MQVTLDLEVEPKFGTTRLPTQAELEVMVCRLLDGHFFWFGDRATETNSLLVKKARAVSSA